MGLLRWLSTKHLNIKQKLLSDEVKCRATKLESDQV